MRRGRNHARPDAAFRWPIRIGARKPASTLTGANSPSPAPHPENPFFLSVMLLFIAIALLCSHALAQSRSEWMVSLGKGRQRELVAAHGRVFVKRLLRASLAALNPDERSACPGASRAAAGAGASATRHSLLRGWPALAGEIMGGRHCAGRVRCAAQHHGATGGSSRASLSVLLDSAGDYRWQLLQANRTSQPFQRISH